MRMAQELIRIGSLTSSDVIESKVCESPRLRQRPAEDSQPHHHVRCWMRMVLSSLFVLRFAKEIRV